METGLSVGVIILAYAKTLREYGMTVQCLHSLEASESPLPLRVLVVETATRAWLEELSGGELYGNGREVLFPERPFHYNAFLQRAYHVLRDAQPAHYLISNNDVVFEHGAVTQLVEALQTFDSVSAWCPGYHDERFAEVQRWYPGFRTRWEFCGWTLMFRASILARVPFEQLFPTDFAFWFQDNYYGYQLQRHGLRHALVRVRRYGPRGDGVRSRDRGVHAGHVSRYGRRAAFQRWLHARHPQHASDPRASLLGAHGLCLPSRLSLHVGGQ